MFVSCSFKKGGYNFTPSIEHPAPSDHPLGLQTENSMLGIQRLGHSFRASVRTIRFFGANPATREKVSAMTTTKNAFLEKKQRKFLREAGDDDTFRFRGYSSYVPPDIISTHKGGYHLQQSKSLPTAVASTRWNLNS